MVNGQFRSYHWDPLLIISQIIAVQSIFYLSLGLLLVLLNFAVERHISLSQLFDVNVVDFSSHIGRVQLSAFLFNSLICAIALWFIVQRAKQCLDFAFTAHFIHFIGCWCFVGFPKNWIWWLMNLISIAMTTLISEYLCMRYEMKAIPVTTAGVSWASCIIVIKIRVYIAVCAIITGAIKDLLYRDVSLYQHGGY